MSSQLNASQVHILQTLRKSNDGLTRAQLQNKCPEGTSVTPGNLGTAEPSDNHVDSLKSLGLVKPVSSRGAGLTEEDERDLVVWRITPKGEKLAEKLVTRKRGSSVRVPAGKLDPAVKRLKALRTYGLELFTDSDLKELREGLGTEYAEVPLTELRQQIVNRRKQGAFADPQDKIRTATREVIRRCGPEGTLIANLLTPDQLKKLEKLAV